jgi:hypothetical protein
MIIRPNPTTARRRRFESFGFRRLLYQVVRIMFVAVLFFLFYLLAHSMVEHRFFRGGWYNQNGTIRP